MWQYWSLKELQTEIGENNLEFLEVVIGAVDAESGAIFLGAKSKLAKLVSSLKDHTFFRNRVNLQRCFIRLPPAVLNKFLLEVGLANRELTIEGVCNAINSSPILYEKMIRFFELDERFLAHEPRALLASFLNLAASTDNPKKITKPLKTLKNYQVRCVQDADIYLAIPRGRMLLQMPTGSGKTRTAMEMIANHLNGNTFAQVIWLANSRELCEQAVQCFVEVWDHLGRENCVINRFWGENTKKIEEWSSQKKVVTIASLQSAWKLCDSDQKKFSDLVSNTSLTVIDEAHIAVAPTYKGVIDQISWASGCRLLGLTATPGRIDDDETFKLASIFHGVIVSLRDPDKNRDNAIAFLRQQGVMSKVTYIPLVNDSVIELSTKEKVDLEEGKDYSERILKKLGSDTVRTIILIMELIRQLNKNSKIVLFAPSVENSFLISSVLSFLGYKSAHLSGKTAPKTRDSLIKQFAEGKYQILCNFGVLSTGFDAPTIDTVVIARPTRSPVLYSQMIGRGMRGPEVGGTSNCQIIEVIDNYLGQGDQDFLYKQFQDYWNGSC